MKRELRSLTKASDRKEGEFLTRSQEVRKLALTDHKLEILRNNKQLLAEIVDAENMRKAWKQVEGNQRGSGIDGKSIEESKKDLKGNWPRIRASILQGNYKPQPLREVEIPKSKAGKGKLSIPTVIDRMIQQATAQVISKYIHGSFEEESYG